MKKIVQIFKLKRVEGAHKNHPFALYPYSSHHSLQNVRISCHCPQGLLVHQDGSNGSPFAPIFLWASSILEHFNWHQNFWQSGAYLLVCICSDLKGKEKKRLYLSSSTFYGMRMPPKNLTTILQFT